HPTEPFHASESKASGGSDKPSSPVVTSGHDPFSSASASGLPSSSTPMKSGMQDITVRNQPGHYTIKGAPDEHGLQELYQRDPDTDAPMPTGKYVVSDGHGGWELSDAQGAKQGASRNVSTPVLPPPAKIDPAQLGPLKEDGTFPGQDGNSYVRSGDGYHPVRYDKQLQGWLAYDPSRPHDPTQSMTVKLDGNGGAEPLPKAELKGGMDDQPWGRALQAKSNWEAAVAKHRSSAVRADYAASRSHEAGEGFRERAVKYEQAQALRDQQSDPRQRESFQADVRRASASKRYWELKYKDAEKAVHSSSQAVADASREQRGAFNEFHSALKDAYRQPR
ncbi:MAG TPA: hypothetical protein VMA74_01765, partial [Dyella sp.]|uniref:hypothetical protein n=1 Tax=Dyella sp. TaxID=1869338 RepID=UPI002CF3F037